MKKLIAFIGRSGSGKDYVAKELIKTLDDNGIMVDRFAFADPVKQHIAILLNLDTDQFYKFLYDEDFKNGSLISLSQMKIVAESDALHNNKHWAAAWNAAQFDQYVKQASLRYDDIDDLDIYMSLREFTVFYGTHVLQKCLGRKVWCNTIFNSKRYTDNLLREDAAIIITDTRFPHEFKECEDRGFVFIKVEEVAKQKTKKLDNIAESYMDMFRYDFLFENDKDNPENFKKELNRLLEYLK